MNNNLPAAQKTQVSSLVREDPLEEAMATHSSVLSGEFHGQRSLVGCGLWGHKESDVTEQLTLSTFKLNFQSVPKLEVKLLQCQIIRLVRMSPITWRLLLKAFSGNVDMLEFGLHAFCFKMHRLKLARLTLNVWTCLFYTHHGKYPFEFWYLDMKQSGKAEKGKHIKPYI